PPPPGHGALSGRLLHLPRHRHPAPCRPRRPHRGEQGTGVLPRGAVEGPASDPARRPAPPGTPRRLDLPGHPRRGAPAGMSYDTLVIGAGLAGLTTALRLTEQ